MSEASHERVQFRVLVMPCCGAMLCWVNPRFPNYCPECGQFVFPRVRGAVTYVDLDAWLSHHPPSEGSL